MIHKVSDFVEKIHSVNKMAERLYHLKYVEKANRTEIDHLIETIKFDCLMIAKDNEPYVKK